MLQERELVRLRQALEACSVHDEDDFDYFPGPLTVGAEGIKHEQSNPFIGRVPAVHPPGSSSQTPEVIDVNPKPGEKPQKGAYIVLETIDITVQHPSPEVWGPQRIWRTRQPGSIPPPEQMPFSMRAVNTGVPASNPRQLSLRPGNDSVWVSPLESSEQRGSANAACQDSSAPTLQFQTDQHREPRAPAQPCHRYERPVIARNDDAQDPASWVPLLQKPRPNVAMDNREAGLNGITKAFARMQSASDKENGGFPPIQAREPLWRVPQAFQTGSHLQRESEALPPTHQLDDKVTPTSCYNRNH